MSKLSQPHVIWYGLIHCLNQIREYIAILKVYNKTCVNLQNRFLNESEIAIAQQLLLNITKLFEQGKNGSNENCSIHLLLDLCTKSTQKFPDNENDRLLLEIKQLCLEYESMPLKKIRDKMLAHNDLKSLFSNTSSLVDLDRLTLLIENCSIIVSDVGERLLGVETNFISIDDLERLYADSLKELMR
jgi:hypothetical protein